MLLYSQLWDVPHLGKPWSEHFEQLRVRQHLAARAALQRNLPLS